MTTSSRNVSRPFVLTIAVRLLRLQAVAVSAFVGIIALLTVGVLVGSLLFADRPDSAVQFAVQPTMWFAFAMGIVTAGSYLRPFVANGVSRSVFWRAAWLSTMTTAVLYGALTAVALAVEHWAFAALSWPHDVSDTVSVWWMLPIRVLLFTATGGVSGLVVAIAYHRTGGWRGTFLLPLTLSPLIALIAIAAVADQRGWTGAASLTAQLLVAAVALVVGTVALPRVMRNLPITPASS
ncbi:hypothetical protein [uncultured Aeromicrobium sp.]|uniref:hypothetical protein n=1 Tax=uncultured Aeromicrobium sp. TaxID=337820 RepID=UPI0025D642B1|nr:hypothetical protein [uncultured Aeromicrobium sp.]